MKADDKMAGADGENRSTQAVTSAGGDAARAPAPAEAVNNALPIGFQLGEFRLERVIGEGGFGVVYLAHDTQLDRPVAVKEYMPSALASRTTNYAITVKSENYRETFEAGLRSFVNEARLLAQFDHPALVKVYRFWEERGTAYMVMPFFEGQTLKAWRRAQAAPPPEAWVRTMFAPLFDAIELLHNRNCFHRDIAPDNIFLLEEERGLRPVLLDFGAARRIIGDMTQALTVILKPGYAPVEQYAEISSMKQGPWTDIYALSAVLYFVAVGRAPPASVGRMMADEYRPARQVAAGVYSANLLGAIDAGLSVKPEDRPQNIAEFRRLVFGMGPASADPESTETADDRTIVVARPAAQKPSGPAPAPPSNALPPRAPAVPSTVAARGAPAEEKRPSAGTTSRRMPLIVGAGVAILVLGVAIAWLVSRPSKAPGRAATTAVNAAEAKRAAAGPPSALLRRLLDARDPSIQVDARPAADSLVIKRDMFNFSVRSSTAGYVYVLLAGTDDQHLALLFPNERDKDNRIEAGKELRLPRESWTVMAEGPAGINRLLVVVSPWPRDFYSVGLGAGEVFSEFSLDAVRGAITQRGAAALAGNVRCPTEERNCSGAFGAAFFEIEETATAKNRGS